MKRLLIVSLLCTLVLSLAGFTQPAVAFAAPVSQAHTYTVLVGSDNPGQGVSLMAYFPNKLQIHVGDTVVWKANSHEMHTITFLAGQPMPDFIVPDPQGQGALVMMNPLAVFPTPNQGSYDGSAYLNSGLLSTDPGQATSFRLTFTKEGIFQYVCIVHGMMMSAEIDVLASSVAVPAPEEVKEIAAAQQAKAWATVPGIIAQGEKQVKPATRNPDGTWTHYVTMGYASGVVDVMRFFPSRLNVNEGDTVVWESSTTADAPHTITFLGGCPDPEMVAPTPQPSGLPLILVNPAVLFPSQTITQHSDLNASGYFNSGILFPDPTKPVSFSLKIGDAKGTVPYYCVLHDTSGMTGTLIVHEGDHDQD